jgi:putative endopeptidase
LTRSRKSRTLTFAAIALAALAVGGAQQAAAPVTHGVQIANMDTSVQPGDDFYEYANGAWIKHTVLPPDRASVGVFSSLADLSTKRTVAIVEQAGKSNPPAGSEARKIADLYASYMDEAAIEARGLAPLEPHLKQIAAISNRRELARALGETLRNDVDALNNTNFHTPNLFGLWIAGGFQDSDHFTAYIMQGGLELPDREYYLSQSERMKRIREKYQAHVAEMLKLAGIADADDKAARIVTLEHAIAETHRSLAENQDIAKANNTWTMADFKTKAPGLDWSAYFEAAGLANQEQFTVWQPEAFTGEAKLAGSVPLDTWKDWLTYHLVENNAAWLPKSLAAARFAFSQTTLLGVTAQRPRDQRGAAVVNQVLGDAVGKIYAQKYFSAEAKQQAQAMVANLINTFDHRLDRLSWMDPATKAEAKAKLATLYVGIGYPETWRDYSTLEIEKADLFGNLWRFHQWDYHRDIARIGTAVDRHEWSMTPQTVNAVNLPLQNALNFPAAILQPPFFDPQAPAAANYGAIGAVIGHEISHTFDTEGSAFDSKGRVRDWWTKADFAHFNKSTAALAAQYDAYAPFPDLHVNGKQTLAENIADNGGISAAYDAWKASLNGQPAPIQDGLSGDQQFFLAYGQNWASKTREGAERQQVMTDPHSPGRYRADEVRNMDAWYIVFNVRPGQTLYLAPADRVQVW